MTPTLSSTVVASIVEIFDAIVAWFGTALATVSTVFFADGALTFIGAICLVGLAIGVTTLVLAWVRSILSAGRG